jgi:hypothetical protein
VGPWRSEKKRSAGAGFNWQNRNIDSYMSGGLDTPITIQHHKAFGELSRGGTS